MSSPLREKQKKALNDFIEFCKNQSFDNKIKNIPTEKAEHLKLVSWLNLKHLKFNHTANERKTTARQGAEFKRLGVKKGFPDISVFLSDKVLFIELKRSVKSKSVVSKEQSEWIEFFKSLSYAKAKICYGANEAIEFIKTNL